MPKAYSSRTAGILVVAVEAQYSLSLAVTVIGFFAAAHAAPAVYRRWCRDLIHRVTAATMSAGAADFFGGICGFSSWLMNFTRGLFAPCPGRMA